MVKTPFYPDEGSRWFADEKTKPIRQDKRKTGIGTDADELTDIDGVGRSLAKKLRDAGYYDIDQIQRASVDELTQIDGVGRARADDLVDASYQATQSDVKRLEDLDGVGPTVANRLREAGINEPYELRGKTQKAIASIDGIGEQRAARIRADVEFEAPAGATETGYEPETESGTKIFTEGGDVSLEEFENTPDIRNIGGPVAPAPNTVSARGPDRQEAIKEHAERTEESRRADESFNAPLMLDEDTWERNKSEYDYPGVDTIPRSRKLERAKEQTAVAREMGALTKLKADDRDATEKDRARGQFSSVTGIGIDTSFRKSENTLAHELGHAIDEEFDRPSGEKPRGGEVPGIFDDEDVLEQAEALSAQNRGTELEGDYLESKNEVFADLFAEATINPRRTKREAPDAFNALKEEVSPEIPFF
jgi:predicted flap endonuclease-1-like 5' DNA nuclease